MRTPLALTLLSTLGLSAQTSPVTAPPVTAPSEAAAPATPAGPSLKWRGALWASAAASDRQTSDGSLFLRTDDAGNGQLSLDGLQVGADVTLTDGWGMKFTILAGQAAKALNAATLSSGTTPAETGSIAWPEAMLTWTGGDEAFKFGRMYSAMGMEVLDGTQGLTASRGLLFTYAVPFAQVGLNWHHAFSASWSSDAWLYNGEDRIQDNNQGKTFGLGFTYNHRGAADRFVTLMAYSGPEQDGLGGAAHTGAEGRKRSRLGLDGQWVWGNTTLVWEAEYAREAAANAGQDITWSGLGAICKYQLNDRWNLFVRAEALKDTTGIRLVADPTLAKSDFTSSPNANLQASSLALGTERRWHATFTRVEARWDKLNKDVLDRDGRPFQDALSLTWSLGTNF